MKITIQPYNHNWPNLFKQEKAQLKSSLSKHATKIQHIGSTSVLELGARPIIDIMIGVLSLVDADRFCIQPIVALKYEYVPSFEINTPERRFFRKAIPYASHIHLVEINSSWWEERLLFRNYLRKNKEACHAYEAHKRKLAEQEWSSSSEYSNAKSDFLKNAICEAKA